MVFDEMRFHFLRIRGRSVAFRQTFPHHVVRHVQMNDDRRRKLQFFHQAVQELHVGAGGGISVEDKSLCGVLTFRLLTQQFVGFRFGVAGLPPEFVGGNDRDLVFLLEKFRLRGLAAAWRTDQDHDEAFPGVLGSDGKETRGDGYNSG